MASVSNVEQLLKKTQSYNLRLLLERYRMALPSFKALLWDREQVRCLLFFIIKSYSSIDSSSPSHARMSGPDGNLGNNESREQMIGNGALRFSNSICYLSNRITITATKKIQSIANILRLSEVVCLAAPRMYTLAVEHKFTKGRKSMNVVAVSLYVACRQKETRYYMLIDFSDLLQVYKLFPSFFLNFSPFFQRSIFRTWSYVSPTCPNP
jgi:transcription factor TFIIB-like protein